MFIEIENNNLMRFADWRFSDNAVETTPTDNRIFDNGYELVNGVVQKTVVPLTYAEKRAAEYPPLGEQFDMIYHDIDNWRTKIAEIKTKYPKC